MVCRGSGYGWYGWNTEPDWYRTSPTGGFPMANKPPKQIKITINGIDLTIQDGEYTGAQLKELGRVPAGETLFLKHGAGKEDPIADTDIVKVHPNMVFESAPDGSVS